VVFDGLSDLYSYFYEKGFQLLNKKGVLGYISNSFSKTSSAVNLRKYLKKTVRFQRFIDFTDVQIFSGATTYPIILIATHPIDKIAEFEYIKVPKTSQDQVIEINQLPSFLVLQNSLTSSSWSFNSSQMTAILNKVNKNPSVKSCFGKSFRGLVTGSNEAFIINQEVRETLIKEDPKCEEIIFPYLQGRDIAKWHTPEIKDYLLFITWETDISNYPSIENHLEGYKAVLSARREVKDGRYPWFALSRYGSKFYHLFQEKKLIWPNLQNGNKFSFDVSGRYVNAPAVFIPTDSLTLLCILNSKIVWMFLKSVCAVRSGGYIEVKPQYFEQIPIPELKNEEHFEKLAEAIISATSTSQNITATFLLLLQSKFHIEKPSKKLQNWPSLDFKGFLAELKKAKVKLSLEEEAEWLDYFTQKKAEVTALQVEINRLDKEIDQMVYKLYGLTEEEIRIVEENTK
jgi:hypothetical protein